MAWERVRGGIAGAVGAGAALGVGELLAGLFALPSPLAAVGAIVVDASPPWLRDFAVANFGTGDKTALAVGTVLIALAIGWLVGSISGDRMLIPVVVFVGLGLFGGWAGSQEPGAETPVVFAAAAVAAATGLAVVLTLFRTTPHDDPAAGVPGSGDRRRFLALAGGTATFALAAGVGGRLLRSRPAPAPGVTIGPIADPAPRPGPEHEFGITGLTPVEVPNREFYRIDTALLIPRVDLGRWRLQVSGMVDRTLDLGYDDLLAMELVEEHVTIACVSNEVGGDLVGNARWAGVRLADLLERAGVHPGAGQVVGRSVDGFTAGFPTTLASDGRQALVAVAMNGDPLPGAHGFPARLIVPGVYGYVSATKWLSEIELTTWEGHDGYWVPRGWAKEAPIKTQSRIDLPRRRVAAGAVTVAGVAWAPIHGVDRVELTVDGGQWMECELSVPLSSHAWVQWRLDTVMTPGEHTMSVRATDGTGYVQTAERTPPRPDGATGHHTVRVRAE